MPLSATLLEAIIVLAAKYEPALAINVINLLKKKEYTVEEVEALFANVKPYSAYGIPDVVVTP